MNQNIENGSIINSGNSIADSQKLQTDVKVQPSIKEGEAAGGVPMPGAAPASPSLSTLMATRVASCKNRDGKVLSLQDVLESIRTGSEPGVMAKIKAIRALNLSEPNVKVRKAKQNALKEQLPAFAIESFENDALDWEHHLSTNALLFDFDGQDNGWSSEAVAELGIERLRKLKNLLAYFKSPKGVGFKAVFALSRPVSGTEHEALTREAKRYFERMGLVADKACLHPARLCYWSYDPNLYINTACKPLAVEKALAHVERKSLKVAESLSVAVETVPSHHNALVYAEAAKALAASRWEDYISWSSLGLIARDVGVADIWLAHSRSAPNYKSDEDCMKKLDSWKNGSENPVTIGTMIMWAKDDCPSFETPKYIIENDPAWESFMAACHRARINYADANPNVESVSFFVGDKNGDSCRISQKLLLEFLECHGFGIYGKYGMEKTDLTFIQTADHIIRRVTDTEIRRFITEWLDENEPERIEQWLNKASSACGLNLLEQLQSIDPKLHSDTRDSVFLYFRNGVLEIRKEGWNLLPYSGIDGSIWSDTIQKRDWIENAAPGEWRTFLGHISNEDAARLEPLRSALGYMLSRYKDRATCKAVILTDEALESERGGTGKGIVFNGLGKFRKVQCLDFRTRASDRFIWQGVKLGVNILHLEDVSQKFEFGVLFNALTSDMEIEDKGESRKTIPFAESAKIGISTNFNFKGSSESHTRRKSEYELHNHYSAKFTPRDEFGHNLFDEWTETEWHRFDTEMASCVKLFLEKGLLEGVNVNADKKLLEAEIGKPFAEYMEEWTKKHMEDPCDEFYITADFHADYEDATGEKTSKVKLDQKRKKWAELNGWNYAKGQRNAGRGFTLSPIIPPELPPTPAETDVAPVVAPVDEEDAISPDAKARQRERLKQFVASIGT